MKKIGLFFVLLFIVSILCACSPDFDENPEAMNTASESVLTIEVYDKTDTLLATGSGFVIAEDSIVATNFHVIEGAYSIKVVDGEDSSSTVKHIIAYDQENDIALLKIISGKGYTPLSANSAEIVKGEKVVAIGSPLGITNTFSTGIVSGYIEEDGVQYIQFTAPFSHGSSGGALFDQSGKVIGITSASIEAGQNLNLAIPIGKILDLYDSRPSEPISMEDFYDLFKINTEPEVYAVGVRTISVGDEFTAEFLFALIELAETEDEIIEILDEYGAEQGGGKLHEVTPGMWVEECDQWCFDSAREPGDLVLIETYYGYTIMFFSGIIG